MKTKKHIIISLLTHIAVIAIILFIPKCPGKKEINIIETVKIIPQAPPLEEKKAPPEKAPPKQKEKPKPKPKPKVVKKKKVIKKYTPNELKKRLQEKLKEPAEQPAPQKAPEKTSTKIRSVLKEDWYLAMLKSKIENSWQQPSRVLMSGLDTVKLTIGFTLVKNGSVRKVKILKSSGIAVVDISALNAVKNASPFQPLPKKAGNKSIDISIDFTLKE